MLNHLDQVKRALAWAFLAIAGVFFITLVVGGICFDLDAIQIIGWFSLVMIVVFVSMFLYALIVFITWFLAAPPPALGVFVIVFAFILGVAIIMLRVINGPFVDMDSVFNSMLSFLN